MGLTRLRSSDIRRARDDWAVRKVLKLIDGAKTPEEIITRCETETRRMGLRITQKSSSSFKWSKMTTTFYGEIRLGSHFFEAPKWAQAATWAHEMVHVYQWRAHGRAKFGFRYVFSTRWRWIYEMHGYRVSVIVRKRLGVSRKNNVDYIEDRPGVFKRSYAMGGLRWSHLKKQTIEILKEDL